MISINGQSILGVLFGSSAIVIPNGAPGWMKLGGKILHAFIGDAVGVCDGVNDNVERQAAINYCLTLPGAVLKIMPGNYYYSTGLVWQIDANYPAKIDATGAVDHYTGVGTAWTFNRPAPASLGAGLDIYGLLIVDDGGNGLNGILLNDCNFVRMHNPQGGNFSTAGSVFIRVKITDYQAEHIQILTPSIFNNSIGIAIESNIAVSSFADFLVSEANISTVAGGTAIKVLQDGGAGVANVDRSAFNNITMHLGNNSTGFDLGTGRFLGTTMQRPSAECGAYVGCKIFDGQTTSPPTIINYTIVGAATFGGNTARGVITEAAMANFSKIDRIGELDISINGDFSTGTLGDVSSGYEGQNGAIVARETAIINILPQSMQITASAGFSLVRAAITDAGVLKEAANRQINIELAARCPATNHNDAAIWLETTVGGGLVQSPAIPKDDAFHRIFLSVPIVPGETNFRAEFLANNGGGYVATSILYIGEYRAWISDVKHNSGASSGTGAQQAITHGLKFTPTAAQIALTAGSATALPFHSAAPDATNIYVTATAGQAWYWATVGT